MPHTVRSSNSWTHGLWSMIGLCWLPTACAGEECQRGEVRCRDNFAEYCVFDSNGSKGLTWQGEDCGSAYCKLSSDPAEPNPFCAKAEEPDPRCAAGTYFELCDGNQVVGCYQGYVKHQVDCTTGESFGSGLWLNSTAVGACVTQGNEAMCALSAEPNPACPNATANPAELCPLNYNSILGCLKDTIGAASGAAFSSGCAGNKKVICFYPYVVQMEDCPAGSTCVAAGGGFCALSATADPACPMSTSAGAEPSFCRNGVIEFCESGWVVRESPCTNGTQCLDSGNGFSYCLVK